jgi:hypothetical protein
MSKPTERKVIYRLTLYERPALSAAIQVQQVKQALHQAIAEIASQTAGGCAINCSGLSIRSIWNGRFWENTSFHLPRRRHRSKRT